MPYIRNFKRHLQLQNSINITIFNELEYLYIAQFENVLKKNKIDLLYFLTPTYNISYNYPYILTHWDLGHKTMFAFPEVAMNNNFELRECYHREKLAKAFAIFSESEKSKQELVAIERINPDRIFVLPLFPGEVVRLNVSISEQENILNKWNVKNKNFYFYPAQFWPHKNHYNLIKAFAIVNKKYPHLKLILSGSDKGNLTYLKEVVDNIGLSEKIIFTGFVQTEEIYTYYKNAIALVMPTFLGPTNMPLLEAYYLNCTVLCSNLEGHIEQMQEKAIYFNPSDVDDIANKMQEQLEYSIQNTQIDYDEENTCELIEHFLLKIYPLRKTFGQNFVIN